MYKISSSISYIIRFYLAYITIEKVSIFNNEVVNYFWCEVISVYTVLTGISYFVTGFIYEKDHMLPIVGVFIYFFIYCIFLFIYWVILMLLTYIEVLPIMI